MQGSRRYWSFPSRTRNSNCKDQDTYEKQIDEADLNRKSREDKNQVYLVASWVSEACTVSSLKDTANKQLLINVEKSKCQASALEFLEPVSRALGELSLRENGPDSARPFGSPQSKGASVQTDRTPPTPPSPGGMCLSNFDCTGAPGASKAWSGSLHFSLSIFCHGCFLRQTFHSHLKAKQYFSREVTGKQPSPLMQKKTNITPGLNCLQGDPGMKEPLQSIWLFSPPLPFCGSIFYTGLKGKIRRKSKEKENLL